MDWLLWLCFPPGLVAWLYLSAYAANRAWDASWSFRHWLRNESPYGRLRQRLALRARLADPSDSIHDMSPLALVRQTQSYFPKDGSRRMKPHVKYRRVHRLLRNEIAHHVRSLRKDR